MIVLVTLSKLSEGTRIAFEASVVTLGSPNAASFYSLDYLYVEGK